ncbi:chemotaxis-specific protein-glutamate methyltransferase CheB [Schleiferia thermophila]|uniref:chemotaxis-specific protein-glutamate methyltransferase CheB n=1 Tax=Schleiferia thermophila TaxID=884107 RepID=UPI002FD880A1
MKHDKIRILLADDSLVPRKLYRHFLEADGDFDVVGEAVNGEEAVNMAELLNPDVISMDIEMPKMNGIEATKKIMESFAKPVVIVSSLYQPGNVQLSMECLAAGAVAIIPKPPGPGHPEYQKLSLQYTRTLKTMAEVKVVRRKQTISMQSIRTQPQQNTTVTKSVNPYEILVIGASAGGPGSLKKILSELSQKITIPIAIVQHIDNNFAEGFAQWISTFSKLPVEKVRGDMPLLPGRVYLSVLPKHLVIKSKNKIGLCNGISESEIIPSVDKLFTSANKIFGANTIAVLLSGMGWDGAFALKQLKEVGAYTIIQDESSCLVFGMPGEAAKLNAHIDSIPPEQIAWKINSLLL